MFDFDMIVTSTEIQNSPHTFLVRPLFHYKQLNIVRLPIIKKAVHITDWLPRNKRAQGNVPWLLTIKTHRKYCLAFRHWTSIGKYCLASHYQKSPGYIACFPSIKKRRKYCLVSHHQKNTGWYSLALHHWKSQELLLGSQSSRFYEFLIKMPINSNSQTFLLWNTRIMRYHKKTLGHWKEHSKIERLSLIWIYFP